MTTLVKNLDIKVLIQDSAHKMKKTNIMEQKEKLISDKLRTLFPIIILLQMGLFIVLIVTLIKYLYITLSNFSEFLH